MLLSDLAVRQAKPEIKSYTMRDGEGLSLVVTPTGGKLWHFRFYWLEKQLRISLGVYPEVSLKQARALRAEARELVAAGLDPRVHLSDRKKPELQSAPRLFSDVASEWHAFKCGRWSQDSPKGSAYQSRRVLDRDVLPYLGSIVFVEVSRAQVVAVVRRIEERGALNMAEKARTWVRQIFEFGIAHGYRDNNPATGLEVIAAEQPPVQHNPIVSRDGQGIQQLVRGILLYQGSLITQCALWTVLYTGVRTIELRKAKPADFDLEAQLWRIPPTAIKQLRGKVRRDGNKIEDYLVSIPDQLVPILQRLFHHTGKRYKHAFPGRNNPDAMISENTVNQAIKRIGLDGQLTGHGIRGTISTALYEMGYPEHLVESQLSHASPNKARVAYDHSEFVEERRAMMQVWADHIGSLVDLVGHPFNDV